MPAEAWMTAVGALVIALLAHGGLTMKMNSSLTRLTAVNEAQTREMRGIAASIREHKQNNETAHNQMRVDIRELDRGYQRLDALDRLRKRREEEGGT